MRLKTIELYQFDELSDAAKEKARAWFRDGFSYDWIDDSRASIEHFCDCFGVRLKDWRIDTWNGFDYDTDAHNDHFRGLTYEKANNMKLSDGYCLGELMETAFKGAFKDRGAKDAFDYALNLGFQDWLKDLRFQETDEYIDDAIIGNEYEFTADGESA